MKSIHELHEQALGCVRVIQKSEANLIELLQTIEEVRGFLNLGFSSMFEYAVRGLKLTESSAYNYITVMRKAKLVPELKSEIQLGNLSVSKARKITAVIDKNNSRLWIEKAKALTQRSLEKEVAKVSPQALVPERTKYVSETRLSVSLGISEECMKKLKRAQDILSQKKRQSSTMEETLEELLGFYLERQDPVEKAKRAVEKPRVTKPVAIQVDVAETNSPTRTAIPARVQHQVRIRDQGQCAFQNSKGERCSNQLWIDLHHRTPISTGGAHSPENIITLCKAHHQWTHKTL